MPVVTPYMAARFMAALSCLFPSLKAEIASGLTIIGVTAPCVCFRVRDTDDSSGRTAVCALAMTDSRLSSILVDSHDDGLLTLGDIHRCAMLYAYAEALGSEMIAHVPVSLIKY
jgi:hypothetical protein